MTPQIRDELLRRRQRPLGMAAQRYEERHGVIPVLKFICERCASTLHSYPLQEGSFAKASFTANEDAPGFAQHLWNSPTPTTFTFIFIPARGSVGCSKAEVCHRQGVLPTSFSHS